MTTSVIQLSIRKKHHKPMRRFLRTQGPFVKSRQIFDAWMQQHPKFARNCSDTMKLQMIGRLLADLLPRYTSEIRSGGKGGSVFVNIYTQKTGIVIGDVAKEVEA